jgi:hypothetical protein
MSIKYTEWLWHIRNDYKIYQMVKTYQMPVKYLYQMVTKIYQHFPFQGPPCRDSWCENIATIWQPWSGCHLSSFRLFRPVIVLIKQCLHIMWFSSCATEMLLYDIITLIRYVSIWIAWLKYCRMAKFGLINRFPVNRGPFLTSPLGANFLPRGEVVPQGWILSPGGEVIPWGWNFLFAPQLF